MATLELKEVLGAQSVAQLTLDRGEAQMLVLAIQAQIDTWKSELNNMDEGKHAESHEERAFFYYELHRCYKMLFDIEENHDRQTRARVQDWLHL